MNKLTGRKKILLSGLIISAGIFPVLFEDIYWTSVMTMIMINVLLATSFRTILLVGEVSLGHAGFMCLGAYTSALVTSRLHFPFGAALITSGVFVALFAAVIGYAFMRVKAIYFVILSLVTAESIRLLVFNWKSLTGGINGLIGFPGPGVLSVFGWVEVDFGGFTEYYLLVLTILIISLLIMYALEKSQLGFIWISIRDNNDLSAAVGIDVLKYKVICFCIACFFAGIAGSLWAHLDQTLSPMPDSTFGVMTSIYLFVYVVVGGRDHFFGPMLGTLILSLVTELSRPIQQYQPMLIGLICVVIAMSQPEGIIATTDVVRRWKFKKWLGLS